MELNNSPAFSHTILSHAPGVNGKKKCSELFNGREASCANSFCVKEQAFFLWSYLFNLPTNCLFLHCAVARYCCRDEVVVLMISASDVLVCCMRAFPSWRCERNIQCCKVHCPITVINLIYLRIELECQKRGMALMLLSLN